MAEIAKEALDNKNKLSTPKSAADFLKEFDSPWTGLARSRRLSVGTQDTIRLLRTHTRETFDQVTSKSMEEALDSLDLDAKEVSDESVFGNVDDNKNTNRKNLITFYFVRLALEGIHSGHLAQGFGSSGW